MTDATHGPAVTSKEIVEALRKLGLGTGRGVMVHSSLKSFGRVEGGARAVIDALMEVVTPAGTLLMPSFNHGAPFVEGDAGVFDVKTTPTTNGIIPDTFWRMPGVHRSLNPTHPFAAWGKNAERYIEQHHRMLTMGPCSPLGLLLADDGLCLLLGIGYGSNTFHHVVEMSTGAPCLGQRTEAYPMLLPDGRRVEGRTWSWRDGLCPFNDGGGRYGDAMRLRGLQKETVIGHCRAVLFRLRDCFDLIAEVLAEGKDGFPPCSGCLIRPRRVPQTVPSDWDKEGQCLLPSSPARAY
ncbi:MAG: AAC(3) family N-acetyltransferase [Phycisphaerae bacterium]|nr:AAC(3) family N-acetyltransferase [Phycisphaerae bacterium]